MDILTNDKLKDLAGKSGGTNVSIYMPTHPVGRETQEGPIRLRNLLKRVEEDLSVKGLRTPDIQKLLAPAEGLLVNGEFWLQQSDGLALFLSSDKFDSYRLPLNFQEWVVVANRFHIKPLLPLSTGDGHFLILAISRNQIRLLECTRYSVNEIPLPNGTPTSMAEALKYDEVEKQLQFHTSTGSPVGRGKRSAMFHGHGTGVDDTKSDLLRFFHKVDEGLQPFLHNEIAPLILAGVEYLLPIYKEANTYNHLLEEGIEGNREDWNAEELHQQAWKIVQPMFGQAQKSVMALYKELAEKNVKASNELKEIVPAAYGGRVDTLFVTLDDHQWGSFDPQTGLVQIHENAEEHDDDLLDFVAAQTILNRGAAYACQPEEMPDQSPVAVIYRY